MTDNTNTDDAKQQYQNILDKYAQEIQKTEPVVQTPQPESETLPETQPQIEPEPQLPQPESPIETEIQPESPQSAIESPEPQASIEENIMPPVDDIPSPSNIFKYIFFISLFIFIGVVGVIAYTLVKQPEISNKIITTPTPTTSLSPTIVSINKCLLNDKSYTIGESFSAADGCNTCSCASDLTITCTEKTCIPTPKISTPSATPSSP